MEKPRTGFTAGVIQRLSSDVVNDGARIGPCLHQIDRRARPSEFQFGQSLIKFARACRSREYTGQLPHLPKSAEAPGSITRRPTTMCAYWSNSISSNGPACSQRTVEASQDTEGSLHRFGMLTECVAIPYLVCGRPNSIRPLLESFVFSNFSAVGMDGRASHVVSLP